MCLASPVPYQRSGRSRASLCAIALLMILGSLSRAQQPPPADDTKARIEQLEKEVQELKALLKQQNAAKPALPTEIPVDTAEPADSQEAIKSIIDKRFKEIDEEKKKKDEESKKAAEDKKKGGFVVGDQLGLTASWDAGGLRFKSEDEAFSLHVGGRLMTDEVWFNQSPGLRKSPIQPIGSPLFNYTGVGPGIGDLEDGFFVRRARFNGDGQIYQVIEYKVEFDFENYNSISFDESYVGLRYLPFIDTIRIGQEHVPFGLEAYTSSRFLPMMERSPLFDCFYQEFAPGVFTNTTFCNQRMTTQHMFHRIDNFNQFNGASFGDGKYAYSGRFSVLPIYTQEGRTLLHLALDYQWRKGSIPSDFNGGFVPPSPPVLTTNTDIVRFRSRQSIRDAVGLQGDPVRVIDTGNIIADDVQSVNGELLFYWNSFWVQSEACLAHVDDAYYPDSKAATSRGDLNYYGAYLQIGYFLTGESRGYDKRFGKYDRVRPLETLFLVRDEDGHLRYGLGAWEILYRYAIANLNDDFVLGGRYGEHTIGLNWYWTSTIKLQMNYINGQRAVPAPATSGNIQGFGLRGALEF